jgi:hypothetical protein
MKLHEAFPGKYMKAEEFAEDEVRILTVKNYEMEEIGQGAKELKPVLSFREPGAKPLVLNKTNGAIIAKFYTDDLDNWIGKRIALHVMEVEMKGDIVKAIRVKTKQPVAQTVQAATIDAEDELFADEPAANMNVGMGIPPMKRQPA